jgi:glutathione S-transferase
MLQVIGIVPSRSIRVNWALEEIGCDYENYKLNFSAGELKSEKFLKINPNGKMPALVADGVPLFESLAICTYLADRFPEKKLSPNVGTVERAVYDQWMYFIGTELEQALWSKGKHTFVFPVEKRLPEFLKNLQWEFDFATKVLTKGLGENDFLVNNELSMVDLNCAMTLRWAKKFDFQLGYDNLEKYLERMEAMPSFKRIREKEEIPFKDFDMSVLK